MPAKPLSSLDEQRRDFREVLGGIERAGAEIGTVDDTPGRSRDALVAERVMGLKVDYEFDEPRVPALADRHDEMGWLPTYSTEIAPAWDVVEKLRADGWTMSLGVNHYQSEPWDCRFFWERTPGSDPERRAIGHGKTAPEAITEAALRAFPEPPPSHDRT